MENDLTREIVLASEAGQLEQVKELLKQGASANAMGPNSGALHVAAFNGHKEVVDTLLQAGADPNIADKQKFYPLHLAASKGHASICTSLLEAGADIEVKTEAGGTALHVAAASGYDKVVSTLLALGANIEAFDVNNNSPLLSAALQGENGCIKLLIEAGANIHSIDNFGENALLKALWRLKQTKISSWKTEGTNEDRKVKYTLEKGAFRYYNGIPNMNDPHELGDILSIEDQLYCASQSWGPKQHLFYLKALDSVFLLIKSGSNVNLINNNGQSPMWWACEVGDSSVIYELHNVGAEFIPMADKEELVGSTCLHRVASSGRIDGLEIYFQLDKSYNINVPDCYGWTPLHYLADLGGHIRMAEILLEKGADKHLKSTVNRGGGIPDGGLTASQVAFHWNDAELGDFLK